MTESERFDHYTAPGAFGCILWTGATLGAGRYGTFWVRGRQVNAHRYALERAGHPIPPGAFVCHRCDQPLCVNPEHLFVGTPSDNSMDMATKARSAHGERQHLAKLTDDDVRFIRSTDLPGVDLARMLGVTPTTISSIRRRKTWRHVDSPRT